MVASIDLENVCIGRVCLAISRTMYQLVRPVVSMKEASQRKPCVVKCQIDRGKQLEGKHYLLIADHFSDFFELDHLKNISSVHVIRKIKSHFARHGIPVQVITDNGPQFVAYDLQIFSKEWDFEHVTCSPYHSQANGKAESAVKEAKKTLTK